nr:hypothetical protein [Streptomyces otsuchiensis]
MNQPEPNGYQWGPTGQRPPAHHQQVTQPIDLSKGPYPTRPTGGHDAQPYAPGAPQPGLQAYAPGYGPQGFQPQQGAPLLYLGDMTVMPDAVLTPSGPLPLKGAMWSVTDMSRTDRTITTAGVVLTCVFVWFCLLGLLFLLMREDTTTGFVQVTVTSGGRTHTTLIPATSPQAGPAIVQQVNWLRSLSM